MTEPVLDAKSVFYTGLRDSITFGVAFIFLYLSIGLLGATQGLSLFETMSTTLFIFSTPLQFLLVQNHGDFWLLVPSILAMNARFLLMSGTLSPAFKETKNTWIMLGTILICPSVFTACVGYFKTHQRHAFTYFLGVGLPIWGVSLLCTYLGHHFGASLSSPLLLAMMLMILPLQFTALAAKHWPHYMEVACYWLGFALCPVLAYVFGRYNLLLTPFAIGLALVLFEDWKNKRDQCVTKKGATS
jgi:predicted branched-subunit amino acid permease